MRKLYPSFILGVFLVLASIVSSAQVSVSATAGTTGPTSYTTLKAAFDAINNGTHSGAVTVTISANTTETAPVLLRRPASGSGSSYTSVTVKPAAGATPTVSGPVGGPLVTIHGSNVTIDGSNNGTTSRDLTFSNGDTSAARLSAIAFLNAGATPATGNTVKNTVLKSALTGLLLLDSANALGASYTNFTFQNNSIQHTVIGAFILGSGTAGNGANTVFTGNSLNATGANANYAIGLNISGVDGATITNNVFGNFNATEDGDDEAIFVGPDTKNTIIDRNTITNIGYSGTNGYGAHGIAVYTGVTNANIRITNNMISNIYGDGWSYASQFYTDNPIGIALLTDTDEPTQSGITIAFNSINMYGNTLNQANAMSMGLMMDDGSTATVVDNIIVNNLGVSTTGYGSVGVWVRGTSAQIPGMNYNDIYVSPTGAGAKLLAAVGTSTATTLAQLMTVTGANANSKNVAPVFVSQTDLHLVAGSNPQLEDSGIPVTGVTTDFDAQTRTATPDIGADEVTSSCVAPTITTQPSAATACTGTNATLAVVASGTGLTYQWKKAGVNVAGATSASYTLNNVTAAEAGSYTVTVSNACGTITSNPVNLTVNAAPTSAFTTTLNQCAGTAYTYTNGSTAGATFAWNFGNGATSTTASPSYTYPVAGNYVVTLVATANGCSATSTRNIAVTTCTALPNVDESISGVRLMPNLVTADAVLRVTASRASNITWSITDEQGRVVLKFNRAANAGQNDISLSLSRLPAGIYQLNGLTSKGVTETVRFVKQ